MGADIRSVAVLGGGTMGGGIAGHLARAGLPALTERATVAAELEVAVADALANMLEERA
jgi:3-hydroxyacyl-CoA dehydrogenase